MEKPNSPKGRGRGRGTRSVESDVSSLRSLVPSISGSHVSGSTLNMAPSSVYGSTGTSTDMEIDDISSIPRSSIGRARPIITATTSGMKRMCGAISPRAKGNNRYLI